MYLAVKYKDFLLSFVSAFAECLFLTSHDANPHCEVSIVDLSWCICASDVVFGFRGKAKAVKYTEDVVSEDDESKTRASGCQYGEFTCISRIVSLSNFTADGPGPSERQRSNSTSGAKTKPDFLKDGKANGRRDRGRGRLSRIMDMPVDIICDVRHMPVRLPTDILSIFIAQIAAHLTPLDLLRLARSTKTFNRLLMSRKSKPIWRAARNTDPDLPDCPPDLSEPEYARLLFETECHVSKYECRVNISLTSVVDLSCFTYKGRALVI